MTHYRKILLIICIISVLLRLLVILKFADMENGNYWEYSELAKNLLNGKGYSLFYFDSGKLEIEYNASAHPFVSAYMPPGYVYFLIPFMMTGNIYLQNIMLLTVHLIISIVVIILIYRFTAGHFSEISALMAAGFAGFLPDFIYAVVSFTPTVLYHAGVILLMIILYDLDKTLSLRKVVLAAFLTASIIYLRSEFIAFFILAAAALIFKRRKKEALIFILLVSGLLMPWILRSSYIYGTPHVPFTTNMGQNLYRGNNPYSIGEWGDEKTEKEIAALKNNDRFELEMSRIYSRHALNYISTHPVEFLKNMPVKWFCLFLTDPSDRRTGNLPYLILSAGFLLAFLYGLVRSFEPSRHSCLLLFILHFLVVVPVFLTLPRYQTMMRIGMIPFAAYGAELMLISLRGIYNKKKELFRSA